MILSEPPIMKSAIAVTEPLAFISLPKSAPYNLTSYESADLEHHAQAFSEALGRKIT
ncbi:hypothetical protein I6F07_03990 [Ensifer sp. IC4062]|nr:hypothetical protein [Ensifer sp. IC4062]